MSEIHNKPRDRFRKFIEKAIAPEGTLPLVHSTSAFSFYDICEGDELIAEHCEHFEKEIIYLFYGRPSYRTQNSVNSWVGFNHPFVFIFDPKLISDIQAVYPFDTGAFFGNFYSRFFDKKSKIGDFELPAALDSAKKLVATYYDNQNQYMLGHSDGNLNIPLSEFEARGVHELARLPPYLTHDKMDERSSSVEIHADGPLSLPEAVRAMVVPQCHMVQPEVINALERWDVEIIKPYEIFEYHSPGEWIGQIYQLVTQVYRELGYID